MNSKTKKISFVILLLFCCCFRAEAGVSVNDEIDKNGYVVGKDANENDIFIVGKICPNEGQKCSVKNGIGKIYTISKDGACGCKLESCMSGFNKEGSSCVKVTQETQNLANNQGVGNSSDTDNSGTGSVQLKDPCGEVSQDKCSGLCHLEQNKCVFNYRIVGESQQRRTVRRR